MSHLQIFSDNDRRSFGLVGARTLADQIDQVLRERQDFTGQDNAVNVLDDSDFYDTERLFRAWGTHFERAFHSRQTNLELLKLQVADLKAQLTTLNKLHPAYLDFVKRQLKAYLDKACAAFPEDASMRTRLLGALVISQDYNWAKAIRKFGSINVSKHVSDVHVQRWTQAAVWVKCFRWDDLLPLPVAAAEAAAAAPVRRRAPLLNPVDLFPESYQGMT